MPKKYWLMKCEYDACTFNELKARSDRTGHWRGVRNYQARNFIRDGMRTADLAFFYQSNCSEPGIAGLVEITREAYPDPSQLDPEHPYYDPKATEDDPRWFSVDIKWKTAFRTFVHLRDLKANLKLNDMAVVQKGQRLSIQPVTKNEFDTVCKMGEVWTEVEKSFF